MTGNDRITAYINTFIPFDDSEAALFAASFTELRVKRRQYVVQPEFVARHRYFVVQGALRAYVVNDTGQEHTVQLAIEEWWISDYNSYMFQQPASMFVVAVEDCTLLQISYEEEQKLKALNYKYETFFRMIAERSAAFMQKRVISGLTLSAEERYTLFLQKYPLMINRFPQYVIASYLGMTTEFLSRIRNQKAKKLI
jgi:CRP-like cAMP-binding protein